MKKRSIPTTLKPQRGLSSEVLSHRRRQRNILKREQEQFLKRRESSAREQMKFIEKQNSEDTLKVSWGRAIINATADGQRAVMASHGIKAGVVAGTNWWTKTLKAFTDFENIYVRYPSDNLPDPNDAEASRKFAVDIRGILQHEIGHIRFTLPYPSFLKTIDGPMRETLGTHSKAHFAWNILEDQRMETLVVEAVPRIATYFETMVAEHIIMPDNGSAWSSPAVATDKQLSNAWLLVSNRMYLNPKVRKTAKDMFLANGYDADEWFGIVESYKTATSYEAMAIAVLDAAKFITKMNPDGVPQPITDHESQTEDTNREGDPAPPTPCDPSEDDLDTPEEEGGAGGEEADTEDTDDDISGSGSATSDVEEVESDSSTTTYSKEDAPTPRDLRDVLDEVIADNLKEQYTHSEIIETLADARERTTAGKGLPEAPQSGKPMTPDQEDMAHRIAIGMEHALNDFVTASQPAWLRHQDRGIIDPLAFRTKEVGALDYHRRLEGDFSSGVDLHLSMLCDVSGSMQGKEIEQLSIGMYATALACNRIGIKTTFVLWSGDHNTGKVWVDGNPTPVIWGADGGTDPTSALNDLDNHNEENSTNHLVLIFTDGAWDCDQTPLSNWSAPGRYIVLSRLVNYVDTAEDLLYKADAYASVNDASQLPDKLTAAIHSLLISSN
jgi:hypothetical protein